MDAETYTGILDSERLQTLECYEMDTRQIIFQQDNDPKHTSNTARKCFNNDGIKILECPAQLPDLNSIENLWAYLKRKLDEYESEPSGMIELWEQVDAEWNKVPSQVCMGLIESMPKRIVAVLKAKGQYTKY